MLNCHADGSAATEAAAVTWYVCASDMGIRIPVRASHATCCEALRLVTHSKGSEKRVVSSSIKSDSITESKSP